MCACVRTFADMSTAASEQSRCRVDPIPPHLMDQPPFIDSDIAKATVCVTASDFEFWTEEDAHVSVPTDVLAAQPVFVMLQFVRPLSSPFLLSSSLCNSHAGGCRWK